MSQYMTPEIIRIGDVATLTGHCSTGCGHDSVVHSDEFKAPSGSELDCGGISET